jgi:hypothetical protein
LDNELHNLYFSNIITIMKSRRLRWFPTIAASVRCEMLQNSAGECEGYDTSGKLTHRQEAILK